MNNNVVIVKGIHYRTGRKIEMEIRDGSIASINELPSDHAAQEKNDAAPSGSPERTDWPLIAPGLVDLQLNGYKGMDFNTLPIAEGMTGEVARAMAAQGVTTYYPTVITNSSEAIEQALRAIARDVAADQSTAAAVGGIHLEGPFISPQDGARGAHGLQFVQAPDWDLFCRWQDAAQGLIRILTLSPEWDNACEFIEKCVASGVKVSIGHTSAEPERIREAVAAGASMSTHLGNGSHIMLPRHSNYLWQQLAEDELWGCMIADGFHLPASMLKVFIRMKGERAVIVSDAAYLAGMEPGNYVTHIGGKVTLDPSGRLYMTEQPKLLAGSAQLQLWGIENVIAEGLTSLPDAWDMASTHPAKLMELSVKDGIAEGSPADFVLLSTSEDGKRIKVRETYKHGKRMHYSV